MLKKTIHIKPLDLQVPLWILLVLALGLSVYAWTSRDSWLIHHRLSKMASLVSKNAGENVLVGLVRAKEVVGFFTEHPAISLGPTASISDRDEISAAIHQLRSGVDTLKINVRDTKLNIAPNRTEAVMNVTVEGVFTVGGETDNDLREFQLDWVKNSDGEWLIQGAKSIQTIQRPPALGRAF